MLIEILAAAAGEAAPENHFGFNEMMFPDGKPNWIALFIAVVLAIMSVGSFYILITKLLEQNRILKQYNAIRSGNFWRANTLAEGASKLEKNSAWRQLVDDGLAAEGQHSKMTDSLEAHDWMHGSLARSEASINARLAGGLPFLATVGATAPFVGLFGTVIGIIRALIRIGSAGQASIDAVAGPVGEALIMTAIGLVVAVPAVMQYNWLMRRNKSISEELARFANHIHGYLISGGSVRPQVAAPRAAASRPAATAASTGAASTSKP